MNSKSDALDCLRLQGWRQKLIWGSDRVSQRLVGHALESRWSLKRLAQALDLSDEELVARWTTGRGLTDAPRATVCSAAKLLQLSPWQLRFLSGELALTDLVTSSSRSDLLARARTRWPVLNDASESMTLLALVLSGDPLAPPSSWKRFVGRRSAR